VKVSGEATAAGSRVEIEIDDAVVPVEQPTYTPEGGFNIYTDDDIFEAMPPSPVLAIEEYMTGHGIKVGMQHINVIHCWLAGGLPAEVIMCAADEAVAHGKTVFAYVKTTVEAWRRAGYKTVDDVMEAQGRRIGAELDEREDDGEDIPATNAPISPEIAELNRLIWHDGLRDPEEIDRRMAEWRDLRGYTQNLKGSAI
jgi:DnaD/phage-associated family protein